MPNPPLANIFWNKSPDQAWRIARKDIASRKEKAFEHAGYCLTYSGPDLAVSPRYDIYIPFAPRLSNFDRTKITVVELNKQSIPAVWLDGSPSGKFVFDNDAIYKGLREYYTVKGVFDADAYLQGIDYVTSRISRAYIRAAYGYAATAVCGADHKRIFYRYELPTLVSNIKILKINALPRRIVRDFYAINKDEAYQITCWAELLLSKNRMELDGSRKNKQDYEQRRYYLNKERKLMFKKLKASNISPLTKTWEKIREEKRYQIVSKYAGAITNHALKDILTDIEPVCPTVVSFPSHIKQAKHHTL